MSSVPGFSSQLVRDWAELLSGRLGLTPEQIRANPECLSYPIGKLRIELMDGSVVEFEYAFHVTSEEHGSIAVFTEHCGHHVFPLHGAKVYRDGKLLYANRHA
jgi:hypothetical protein